MESFSTKDLLAIDTIHREDKLPEWLKERVPHLLEAGVIEKSGKGQFILSRRFYRFLGKTGVYTRKRGLDREHNKALLEKHIVDNGTEGCRFQELQQVLPNHTRNQIHTLLRELRMADKIHCMGQTKGGRWYPGPTGSIVPKPVKRRIKTQ